MKRFDTDLEGFVELQNVTVHVKTHMERYMEA
jgi:hypothetical protein